jgi:hypothetical protein
MTSSTERVEHVAGIAFENDEFERESSGTQQKTCFFDKKHKRFESVPRDEQRLESGPRDEQRLESGPYKEGGNYPFFGCAKTVGKWQKEAKNRAK